MPILNSRNIFLIDSLGALLSLILTAGVLPFLSAWTGLPREILMILAVFPLVYCLFSLTCYLLPSRKNWMLFSIILANSLYVLVSASLMLLYEGIKMGGLLFLTTEILVLIGIIWIEWRIYRKRLI